MDLENIPWPRNIHRPRKNNLKNTCLTSPEGQTWDVLTHKWILDKKQRIPKLQTATPEQLEIRRNLRETSRDSSKKRKQRRSPQQTGVITGCNQEELGTNLERRWLSERSIEGNGGRWISGQRKPMWGWKETECQGNLQEFPGCPWLGLQPIVEGCLTRTSPIIK